MKILCKVQLSEHRYKTPEGYLVCQDCIIARTGKQTYLKSELWGISEGEDEYIDVDRKPEQVFDERTLASFEGKPLTIDHPDVSVSPENYKELAVGNVHNVRRGMFGGSEVILADITVYDAHAIDLIESKEMEELSCGYDCDITDGPNPEQINIRGNHVALCEQGRAGIARIQDSVENASVNDEDLRYTEYLGSERSQELRLGGTRSCYVRYSPKLDESEIVLMGGYKGQHSPQIKVKHKLQTVEEVMKLLRKKNVIDSMEDSLKKKDSAEIDASVSYHYRTDKANDLDMSRFEDRMIGEYLPNELSRQLTKEEKEYVKEKIKSYAKDHWGAKPVVKDEPLDKDLSGIPTVKLSFRMPEYGGRDKRLHYMPGIRNCVALAKELDEKASSLGVSKMKTKTTEAPFSEGDRKDSWWEMSNKHGWSISREWDSSAKPGEFNEYYVFTKIGDKTKVGDSVQKGTLIQEFGRYADQYKVIKIQGNVLYCEEINTGKTILFKKDKENVDWAVITKSEIQDSASECGKTPKAKDADPEKKYMVYHFSFANQRNTLDADNLSLEEANRIFDQAIDHFSRFNKSVYHTSGFSVTLQEESDFFGDRDPVRYAEIDENGEIKETSNLRKDSPALACEPFEGVYKGYDYHYGKEDPDNVRIFKKGEFIKNMPIGKCLETGDAEKEVKRELFAMDEYEWWSKTHPGGHMDFWEDSILPAFIISLGDDYYLDEYDRPTKDIAKARRFDTREKADEYRKIYCKGEVKEIDDHVIDSAIESEDILKVKKLIEGITYDKISSDKELKVIDILFPDRINQRKAARKLNKLYDLEMSEEEGANAYWVTLYEAYDKDPDAPSMEDSEPVEGEEYSKRFYVKAIKALESKKSKLEKNELIDVNQEDYEEQKEKMISEIDKQIAEYKGKLNAE